MKIKKSNERRKKPAFIRLFATGIAHLSITVSVIILEQMTGIEPAFSAWEADALPLSYICISPEQFLLYPICPVLSSAF